MRILNLGAGIQSTTLYLMMMKGEIEPADHAIFADTQEEPEAVYSHLKWLQSLAGIPIHVTTAGKLGDDLKNGVNSTGQRFASIPAYTKALSEKEGKLRRQCTQEYKLAPILKHFRYEILQLPVRARMKGRHTFIFGISLDEMGRAKRIVENKEKWQDPEFPLIALRMTRGHCIEWLRRYGVPHEVPRSACVFCPFKDNSEWRRLRDEDPAGWQRAIEIDKALRVPGAVINRNVNQLIYLHRNCEPLTEIDLEEKQHSLGFATECVGMCGV